MAKIIELSPEYISIGMDDGSIREVSSEMLSFIPHIGDEVEVFETTNKIIVSKVEKSSNQTPNIVIHNTNTNTNINRNASGGREKNKWVSLLLCVFLGVFGAHKFYEGKVGTGILYLFTFGLFGIGVIIDLIALLNKPNPYYV